MFKYNQSGNALAVFSKIVIRLQWDDENRVLDYIINWLLNNMVLHSDMSILFQKLTKVIKNVVDYTVAQGSEKVELLFANTS